MALDIYSSIKIQDVSYTVEETPYKVEHIIALNDSTMMSGRFYLRSGYISEDMYYQYMVELSDGSYVYNKAKATESRIYCVNDNYRVERYLKNRSFLFMEETKRFVKIYIPKESITSDFNVDLN